MYYKPEYPLLCSPIKLAGLTLNNRMIAAPMGFPELTAEGLLTQDAIAFYELRAKGGAAMITVGEAVVHYATGKSHGRSINLSHPDVLGGLTNLARAIKRHGAAASIELAHGGKFSAVDRLPGERKRDIFKYGPVNELMSDGSLIRAMPVNIIKEIVESYGKAAALCKRAGFDMVLVHGGHGWLIEQFYSAATNTRTDEYGGSRDNRARLAIEILDSIRNAVGRDFPVEFRMSAEEGFRGGYALEEAVELAKLIEGKIDLLHVSTGSNEDSFYKTHPSMFMERGCNVRFAEEIKKHVTVPVGTIGALNEPDMMEDIIKTGKADVVYMARALLADPELPRKIIQNRSDEILKCVRCFTCLAERMQTQTRICALNPQIGREYESLLGRPETKSKKVLIAGGGVGGMEAAITAASRGHKVTLCEKSSRLGGALNAEKKIPFKKDVYDIIKTLHRRMELMDVKIKLNIEVNTEYVRKEEPDVLIVAVGAEPIIPFTGSNVVSANELKETKVGNEVVVLGGGLVGCETAVFLAKKGHRVTLCEMSDKVAADANARQRPALIKQLKEHCKIKTGVKGISADENGLLCEDGSYIKADTIVVAIGQRPRYEIVNSLRNTAPEVKFIGDCVKAGTIRDAIFNGYHAGMDI